MESFIDALKQRNLENIRAIPKSDLHNHFVLGGSRQYLQEMTGIRIEPVTEPISSKEGLRLKAHVGEWGSAEDVRRAVEELEFQEAQDAIFTDSKHFGQGDNQGDGK